MLDLHLDDPTHLACISDAPGHVVQPDLVARAVRADGTPWRLTRVGPHRIELVGPSGERASWWLHDFKPFVQHLRTADPTVWVYDFGVVRVGGRYVAVTSREHWTPCARVTTRRPGTQVAWLVAMLQPRADAEGADLVPPHTATLYHLDPPYQLGRLANAPIDWVLVLAYQRDGRGITVIYEADATGRLVSPWDLPGSHDDGIDHVRALQGLGYEIALPPAGDC
ncbi:hypothetical protein [Cellulomonas xiejunii]|uniref:RES domain-containing protein n=1 Tax=Cellulomonas xiejunii TaxID=2968083 RepID=A0ABY5KME9_9CELL|nr:hypothetical protein [Cellulomonas xiejunii]MCC2319529.1 hypothetical protein [Cellulomonas xiejunii]UUI71525.1 hypothetical protein NP048_17295 [Cellulomonas xiejunii]